MSRLVLTLALVVLFSVLAFAASADSGTYGTWSASAVSGAPTASYLGQTGLLITPTALVAPSLEGSIFYNKIESDPRRQAFYGVVLGLPEGLEASAVRLINVEPPASDPSDYRSVTCVNAKYQIPLDRLVAASSLWPKVALGVFDATDQVARVWYITLSRSFTITENPHSPLNLHLGYGNKNRGSGRLDGVFGGADFAVTADTLLQAEYDGNSLNAGVRYYPAKWACLDLGVVAGDLAWGGTINDEF